VLDWIGLDWIDSHGHKNTVLKVACNDNGNWFVSASRDCMLRLFDIRMMKELQVFRGHEKEVNCTSQVSA